MKLNDLKIGWRLLISDPSYSAVAVVGLALGFAACFLLLGYLRYSFSYDTQVPEAGRVYMIKQRYDMFVTPMWGTAVPLPFDEVVKRSGLAELSSYLYPINSVARYQNRARKIEVSIVKPDFQAIFNLNALQGDLRTSLSHPDTIAITVSSALKIFGELKVLNKTVEIAGVKLLVAAILPDPPSNSSRHYEALVGPHTLIWATSDREEMLTKWKSAQSDYFIKLPDHTRPEPLTEILQQADDKFGYRKGANTKLVRLTDIYFDDTLAASDPDHHGNQKVVVGLGIISLLIMVIAATNYVNLAIVRTTKRQKEIGVHKMMGATAGHIVQRFIAESMLVSMSACCLGILIAWLMLPWFSELMSRPLDDLINSQNIEFAILLGIVIGFVTGIYPAWIALKVNASDCLVGRGNVETRSGLWVRRVLTVMQFSVAMSLAGLTLTILWQTYFACNVNPGYDSTNLLVVDTPFDMEMEHNPDAAGNLAYLAFKSKLTTLPNVTGVAGSLNIPGSNGLDLPLVAKDWQGHDLKISGQRVTSNFFEVYRLKAVAGRLFDPHNDRPQNLYPVVLNWSAAKALGFKSPDAAIGQSFLERGNTRTILGIAPDIRLQSMRGEAMPVAYIQADSNPAEIPALTIRIHGDFRQVEKEVESIWPTYFPIDAINIRSAKDAISESYADDVRLAKLLCASSILAIVLAAFGMYVLSAYSVQRRAREFVLRKLYGANGGVIAHLLALEFGVLISIGAIVGLPIAYVASSKYLAEFVERAPMGVWPLVGALLIAIVVACLGIFQHLLIAMRMVPANLLKD
ncbi:putative ABC transport system permease protein [Oxalobacteraceae bacterium GrIS 2.11]